LLVLFALEMLRRRTEMIRIGAGIASPGK